MLQTCRITFRLLLPLLIFLSSCVATKHTHKNINLQSVTYNIDSTLVGDSTMKTMVTGYKHQLDTLMNQVVGYTGTPLTKAQPNCSLGHLMADALLQVAKEKDASVQAAISNQGGIRIHHLAAGKITLGNIYEIMPFDNTLVVLDIPGKIVAQWCRHIAEKGGWPISNISFEIENGQAKNIQINNAPLDENAVYKIATSDYLANGGDNCTFLKSCAQTPYNILMREAMILYVKQKSSIEHPLNIELQNRIKDGK